MSQSRSLVPRVAADGALARVAAEEAASLDDGITAEARLGAWAAGIFFIGFLGFAALVPLDSGAMAPGVVAVSGNRQAVQHREGGVVTQLMVKNGQTVAAGTPLLVVGAPGLLEEERALTREWVALLAERARLEAERSGAAMLPPAEFARLEGEDGRLAAEAVAQQQKVLADRRETRARQRSVLLQQAEQAMARTGGFAAEAEANRAQRRLIGEELAGLESLAKDGFASRTRIRALERTAAALDGQDGALRARMAEAREAEAEARMQALLVDRTGVSEADERLRQVAERLNAVVPRRSAAQERARQAVVRAPAAGQVVGLSVFTVGGVVGPGQMLMEVVPSRRDLVVRARLQPQDADTVVPGQAAEVRFSSFRGADAPRLAGEVTTVSADALVEERTGLGYYEAEVAVPGDRLEALGAEAGGSIRPGLPVEVFIRQRERTLLAYLLEPLTRMVWRSGREE